LWLEYRSGPWKSRNTGSHASGPASLSLTRVAGTRYRQVGRDGIRDADLSVRVTGSTGVAGEIPGVHGPAGARARPVRPEGVHLLEQLARRLVELTSVRRREADADLAPLETDPELLPARTHALDTLERDYVDRVMPGGLDPSDRVALLHRRLVGGVGEKLASAEQSISAVFLLVKGS
jgi:hypothetical protein